MTRRPFQHGEVFCDRPSVFEDVSWDESMSHSQSKKKCVCERWFISRYVASRSVSLVGSFG